MTDFDVVIPSAGRPSLAALLDALGEAQGPPPSRILVVLDGEPGLPLPDSVEVVRSHGRGPAAARNAGWRASRELYQALAAL